jgi:hypothetical protein
VNDGSRSPPLEGDYGGGFCLLTLHDNKIDFLHHKALSLWILKPISLSSHFIPLKRGSEKMNSFKDKLF